MFEDYYTNQVMRGGSDVFKGYYYQRGYGLRRTQRGYGVAGVMNGWACMATPIVKDAVKNIGKEPLNSGIGLVSDITSGKNFSKSLKTRAKEAGRNSLKAGVRSLAQHFVGGKATTLPIKRKWQTRPTLVVKRPQRHQHHDWDIFD